jgi:hypothetical protein
MVERMQMEEQLSRSIDEVAELEVMLKNPSSSPIVSDIGVQAEGAAAAAAAAAALVAESALSGLSLTPPFAFFVPDEVIQAQRTVSRASSQSVRLERLVAEASDVVATQRAQLESITRRAARDRALAEERIARLRDAKMKLLKSCSAKQKEIDTYRTELDALNAGLHDAHDTLSAVCEDTKKNMMQGSRGLWTMLRQRTHERMIHRHRKGYPLEIGMLRLPGGEPNNGPQDTDTDSGDLYV